MNKKELSFEKRKELERNRIMSLIPDADESQLESAAPLIDRLVFLGASLAELEETMQQTGLVEEYHNGENQTGMKQSAAAQTYNNFLKSYSMLYTKLLQLVPARRTRVKKQDAITEESSSEDQIEYEYDDFTEQLEKIRSIDPETVKTNRLNGYKKDLAAALDHGSIDQSTYDERLQLYELELDREYGAG